MRVEGEVTISAARTTPLFFEDTNFQIGDTGVLLDINAVFGRNATSVTVICDGPGNITAAFSSNGTSFGYEVTLKNDESLSFSNMSVDTVRITWVSDSAYRVIAV